MDQADFDKLTRDDKEFQKFLLNQAWKIAINTLSTLIANWDEISDSNLLPVSIKDPIESWALKITIQDQHTEIIDLKLSKELDTITILNDYSIGDQTIDIETTWFVPVALNITWHTICLKDINWGSFLQTQLLSVTLITWNQYTVKLDMPLDFAYWTTTDWCIATTNLAVDWSVTSQIFNVSPYWLLNTIEWDINRIMFSFWGTWVTLQDPQPDDSDFWVWPVLTNWIVLRHTNWVTKNIFNAKANWDLRGRCWWDLTYVPASKTWLYAVHGRRTFNWQEKNWVTIRMWAVEWDEIQIIIQDDLTNMTNIQVIVQWQVVQN